MKEDVKFWYPMVTIDQMTFEGTVHKVSVVAQGEPGHIYANGGLLCGKHADAILVRTQAKPSLLVNRKESIELCKNCQREYKKIPGFAWQKWTQGA